MCILGHVKYVNGRHILGLQDQECDTVGTLSESSPRHGHQHAALLWEDVAERRLELLSEAGLPSHTNRDTGLSSPQRISSLGKLLSCASECYICFLPSRAAPGRLLPSSATRATVYLLKCWVSETWLISTHTYLTENRVSCYQQFTAIKGLVRIGSITGP